MPQRKKSLTRELQIIQSTLKVGLKRDVGSTNTGKKLRRKGFIKKDGTTSVKGKKALSILKQLRR